MGSVTLEAEALLVERAKIDEQAFRQLYERHLPGLYRYAYYRTGNQALAEDVVAQTFLRVWEHLPGYEQRGIPFCRWLYRIASNVWSSMHAEKVQTVGLAFDPGDTDGDTVADQADLRLDLLHCLCRLPEAQQQVLVLRYVQDLSLQEVAEVMGRSEGSIKQLAFRGLRTLRERMRRDAERI